MHNARRNVTRPRRRARSLAVDLDELLADSRIDCLDKIIDPVERRFPFRFF